MFVLIFSVPSVIHANNVNEDSEQIVFVIPSSDKSQAGLKMYEVSEGFWRQVGETQKIAVGSLGIIPRDSKQEGDGGTPAGTYPLQRAFGYSQMKQIKIRYKKFGKKDIWVDDPHSKYYNQYLPGKKGKIKGKSVFSNPEIYGLFLVIEYNTINPISGKGSMIFIHAWSDLNKPTYGCLGLKKKDLLSIVNWLDPKKNPQLIILKDPIYEYEYELESTSVKHKDS